MTTITVDRALIAQALIALTYKGTMGPTRRQRRAAAVDALRSALRSALLAPERKPMPILEVNARWEQSVLDITRLQYYQVVREVEAFHGITGGKP